jgi:hypothetical protein
MTPAYSSKTPEIARCEARMAYIDAKTALMLLLMQVVDVDPEKEPGDNTTRTELGAIGGFLQVSVFDHTTRKKT